MSVLVCAAYRRVRRLVSVHGHGSGRVGALGHLGEWSALGGWAAVWGSFCFGSWLWRGMRLVWCGAVRCGVVSLCDCSEYNTVGSLLYSSGRQMHFPCRFVSFHLVSFVWSFRPGYITPKSNFLSLDTTKSNPVIPPPTTSHDSNPPTPQTLTTRPSRQARPVFYAAHLPPTFVPPDSSATTWPRQPTRPFSSPLYYY